MKISSLNTEQYVVKGIDQAIKTNWEFWEALRKTEAHFNDKEECKILDCYKGVGS